jgi:hypothetical protein
MKLEKNAIGTCTLLSEAYGVEVLRKSSVSKCHKRFKVSPHFEITDEENEEIKNCDDGTENCSIT